MGEKNYFFRQVGKWLILIFLFGIFLFSARAEAGYFSDDFESGLGNWIVSGHDWDLTESTSRSATHSLTDSPSGDYAPDTDASAILAHSIDLTTSTSPVLTFWHKHDLQQDNGDNAVVYISKDGGSTWIQLRYWSFFTSTTWALEQIDLSDYKTSQVKIRFRLIADGDANVGDGWDIDDVEIKENSGSISYFFDNFEGENSLSNWVVKKGGVDLTATPNTGYIFNSWIGCDTLVGNQCTVKVDVIDRIVIAEFIEGCILSDMNEDGMIDISDVIRDLRCALGLSIDPYLCMPRGDNNCDDDIDISDVILTLRKALGIDLPEFCSKCI